MVDRVLTASDPEPPAGTVVRDDCGTIWKNDGHYPACWVEPDADVHDPESWTKIAGNYGPVTVIEWVSEYRYSTMPGYGVLPDDQLVLVVAALVDPGGHASDAAERAQNIIRLVRANTTCIGDMNRGCY
ncbi:hypothetical protein BG418_18555 [Streptomyces sp. CBMA152]|nr:hypothetical protein [Streptomyces sp. CBMA152]